MMMLSDATVRPMKHQPSLFFEDIPPGTIFRLGEYEMTEAEILDFGRSYDPQYFHTDPQAALDSPFGGLIASGWHTCAVWARLWIDEVMSRADGHGSGGMEQIRWLAPVRPGDVVTGTVEVLEASASSVQARRGTLILQCEMTNQRNELVMTMRGRMLIGRRSADTDTPDSP